MGTDGDAHQLPESQSLGELKNGVDYDLEEYADELLAKARRLKPRSQDDDPYEVLSPGQIDRRRSREVYNKNGFPEPHLYAGIYRRAHNPNIVNRKKKRNNTEDLDTMESYFPGYWSAG